MGTHPELIMRPEPILLAAYPRSGSTWLRFIVCNAIWADEEFDFDLVNKRFPGLDGDEGIADADMPILFLKTHEKRHAGNVVFLHRHIGDVLTSEWWYKRKFHDDTRSLEKYVFDTNFGQEWRELTDFYFPARINIAFDMLNDVETLRDILPHSDLDHIVNAMMKSSFDRMQKAEEKGFGIYPAGTKEIKFIRNGTSNQWHDWPADLQAQLIDKNKKQLKLLGYE